jgi:hypothetical protein
MWLRCDEIGSDAWRQITVVVGGGSRGDVGCWRHAATASDRQAEERHSWWSHRTSGCCDALDFHDAKQSTGIEPRSAHLAIDDAALILAICRARQSPLSKTRPREQYPCAIRRVWQPLDALAIDDVSGINILHRLVEESHCRWAFASRVARPPWLPILAVAWTWRKCACMALGLDALRPQLATARPVRRGPG